MLICLLNQAYNETSLAYGIAPMTCLLEMADGTQA